ncbi:MbtH family protein [Actinoplanes sp. NBRC 103695]|uniref:MbtH family protein n=1 Tax=Actinoplanes sp. NBRC 103695 TaxID=3032202 RepID=UPI0024A6067D|nr:MbtH family protein [Actinoplanes sp. NBRC 103695]GLY97851.1 protein mbtH [Actinoplanes sp. NBRC 103695]
MSNPFERDDIGYLVLVNGENQHSLWPETIDVPAGWRVVLGPDTRDACLAHIDREWTDIRPASLLG